LPRASSEGPIIPAPDGVSVAIRVSPRAKTDRLLGIVTVADGRRMIKASVSAPAHEGRANQALLQLLARVLRLPRRDLSISAGAESRNKFVRVQGDPQQLLAKLSEEIANLPAG